MQNLDKFILEKLKISKIERKYKPKTKEELLDIISKEIEANGTDCSLNHIDVSNITDMGYLFKGSDFIGDISDWNVSNVKYMYGMFESSKFNGDISNWNVSNVIDMSYMFMGSKYNGDISNWDVSNVTRMDSMFNNCKFNGDISNWDVSNVKSFYAMFRNSNFNGDISKWQINPAAKGHMNKMFMNSPLEKTPPDWYYKYV